VISYEERQRIESRYRAASEIFRVKDPDTTYGHSLRVATIIALLCDSIDEHFGLPRELIFPVGFIHDIGKIGMPDNVLCGTVSYNKESIQRRTIEMHPALGLQMVKDLPGVVRNIVFCHQEKFDGSGYPRGIAGEEIPLEGRIVAAVDALDAMLSKRPYKEERLLYGVLKDMERSSGSHFDPEVVVSLSQLIKSGDRKIDRVFDEFYSKSLSPRY